MFFQKYVCSFTHSVLTLSTEYVSVLGRSSVYTGMKSPVSYFEARFHEVAQTKLELILWSRLALQFTILLPWPPKNRDYRCTLTPLAPAFKDEFFQDPLPLAAYFKKKF